MLVEAKDQTEEAFLKIRETHCMKKGVVDKRYYYENMKFSWRYLMFSFKHNMTYYLELSLKICANFPERKHRNILLA